MDKLKQKSPGLISDENITVLREEIQKLYTAIYSYNYAHDFRIHYLIIVGSRALCLQGYISPERELKDIDLILKVNNHKLFNRKILSRMEDEFHYETIKTMGNPRSLKLALKNSISGRKIDIIMISNDKDDPFKNTPEKGSELATHLLPISFGINIPRVVYMAPAYDIMIAKLNLLNSMNAIRTKTQYNATYKHINDLLAFLLKAYFDVSVYNYERLPDGDPGFSGSFMEGNFAFENDEEDEEALPEPEPIPEPQLVEPPVFKTTTLGTIITGSVGSQIDENNGGSPFAATLDKSFWDNESTQPKEEESYPDYVERMQKIRMASINSERAREKKELRQDYSQKMIRDKIAKKIANLKSSNTQDSSKSSFITGLTEMYWSDEPPKFGNIQKFREGFDPYKNSSEKVEENADQKATVFSTLKDAFDKEVEKQKQEKKKAEWEEFIQGTL